MATRLNKQLSNHVLHLASWPPLHQFLQESAPHMARICALLARRPSVGMLIPVMLDMPPQIAYSLLETLHANGHIYPADARPNHPPALSSTEAAEHQKPADRSFLAKLWQRLINPN